MDLTAYRDFPFVCCSDPNDVLVSGTVACTAFGSGMLQSSAGWLVLNLAVVPLVLAGLCGASWRRVGRARPAMA